MIIDPFIVLAQIINFLILVALLKRFLYKPITQAMEARSQRIERQLTAAASKEEDAETEKKLYLQKQQALETQKQEWLEQAKQEVELEKKRLTESAIAEVNKIRAQWYEDLNRDRQKLSRQIRDRLSHQITLATRKALSDLANADLEAQIIKMFIKRLDRLDDSQLKTLHATPTINPHNPQHTITVYSSFTIPDAQRDRLSATIREQIAAEAEVQFAIEQDLICGIELCFEGYKIAWNIEHYLTELETATAKVLRSSGSKENYAN